MSDLIFDALMLGRNRNVAREEYLTYIGDKNAACFEAQEKRINFSDITSDTTGIIHLKMSVPGYSEIEIYSDDRIINFDKKVITSDEFQEDGYEFSFTVIASNLHNGRNFARIIFRNPVCSCDVDIIVDNSVRIGYAGTSRRGRVASLLRSYIDLRLGNLFQTEWQEKMLDELSDVSGGDISDMFLLLYKANVLISCGRQKEAGDLIEFVGSQLQKLPTREWELICYFYYISSLYEMNDEVTKEMAERVRTIYELHPDWKILWILLYMDEELSRSPGEIVEMIEGESLIRGCNSPVMYYEAMEAYKKNPELITEPSSFVIRTLHFAAREDFLSVSVCTRFAEVIWHTESRVLKYSNLHACTRILADSFDRFHSNIILKSLCKVLICNDNREEKFHPYYEKAINEFLETKDLYSYFVYSADHDKTIDLPAAVLEFFAGREYELGSSRDYYFACLVRGKERYKKYYDEAHGNMVRSAREALDRGLVNNALAVIYRDLMDTDRLGIDQYERMLEILCTREVVTGNTMITSALVFHKEFNEYREVTLIDGRGLVRIFTDDAVILFKDTTGNLYCNIDYVLRRFMPRSEYSALCMKHSPVTRYMMVGDNLKVLKSVREPAQILEYLYRNMGKGQLRSGYEQELLKDFIADFSRNSGDRRVYDRLLDFLGFNLENSTRARLIEVMIDRMMYREAFEEIKEHGFEGIDDDHARDLAHVIAEITDYEHDEVMEELACRVFLNCERDPVIFRYMCRCYDGRLDVLILMYISAKADGINDMQIAERVLSGIIRAKEFPAEAESIFSDYFAGGDDVQLKKDFMAASAAMQFTGHDRRQDYIFRYVERGLAEGEKFPDLTVIAYIMFMRNRTDLENRSIKTIRESLNDLVRRGIMLEEFKEFRKYFELPSVLSNTYIAEKIVEKDSEEADAQLNRNNMFQAAPQITYELKGRTGNINGCEAMKEVAPGVFTRYFTLFFGESVGYSINGGRKDIITYRDIHVVDDDSRYSALDAMIRKLHGSDMETLKGEAGEYFIKSMLMDKLF